VTKDSKERTFKILPNGRVMDSQGWMLYGDKDPKFCKNFHINPITSYCLNCGFPQETHEIAKDGLVNWLTKNGWKAEPADGR
jgi:hypothetical protein